MTTAVQAEVLQLTPHESVRIVREDRDAIEVEATWAPAGSPPPKHFHPAQDEHFEVHEGVLSVRVGGQRRDLTPGDSIDVPRGAVHQMWNAGDVPARATWRTSPGGRTGLWFRELAGLGGAAGPLAFGAYLTEFRDVFRLAGPQPVLVPLLGLLGVLGRARGHRPGPWRERRGR